MPSGDRYGRWTVLEPGPRLKTFPTYLCRCDCGVERLVVVYSLDSGNSRSCGCLSRDTSGQVHRTHGLSRSPEYKTWLQIKQRCNNPNNPRYADWGGRGIRFIGHCNDDFVAFRNFVGPRPSPSHSIERPDNSGPYTGPCAEYPNGNMRWGKRNEQNNKK